MLNAKEILEENLIVLDNAKGKPAQVGYDLSIKSISKLIGGGKVLNDKPSVNKFSSGSIFFTFSLTFLLIWEVLFFVCSFYIFYSSFSILKDDCL